MQIRANMKAYIFQAALLYLYTSTARCCIEEIFKSASLLQQRPKNQASCASVGPFFVVLYPAGFEVAKAS